MSIHFHEVSKSYGEKMVLDKLSLSLPETGTLCLFGPSGCGKTTVLRMLAGLITPDSGRIEGLPGQVSFVFQENRLLPWYTVGQNLALVTDDPVGWLDQVHLAGEGHLYPDELSGGMQRRVAFARALAHPADVLLLDEPFKELDRGTRQEMIALLKKHQAQRKLTVLVTHSLEEAHALADTLWHFTGPPLRRIAGPTSP